MENSRNIGIYVILSFYLFVSISMLSDSKYWNNSFDILFNSISSSTGLFTKSLKNFYPIIIQSCGTLGVLLSFSTGYGSKSSLSLLIIVTLILIISINLPLVLRFNKDFNSDILNFFKMLAILGGLLQEL